ncbi:ATP-binding protein [Thermodesulfobacteriota bacterium]
MSKKPTYEELEKSVQELEEEAHRLKKAEEELRESEAKFRTLTEYSPNMIFINKGGQVVYVNRRCEEALGYSHEEFLSPNFDFLTLMSPESRELVISNFKKHMQGQELDPYEYTLLDKGGQKVEAIITTTLLNYEGKKAIFGIVTDITERKKAERERQRLESKLNQIQRMEAIGTLAGGIAHNFNNLLMGIQGNASLVRMDLDPSNPNNKRLENIENLVQNGSSLTNQLLGYAREGKYEVRHINLNYLAKSTTSTFGAAKREISIHLELSEDLCNIEADPGQIEQALLNLFVNAADAMPRGGDLFVKTKNATHEDIALAVDQPEPGDYVLLSIRDTGDGMSKETIERIFEPFFTTKGLVKGTGLGLAFVYGIVQTHGGYIDVQSEEGQGTTFKIYLPAFEKEPMPQEPASEEWIKGVETVLFVDDEVSVIDVGEQFLKRMGYFVFKAHTGEEALDVYKREGSRIDIVILDMIMPGLGGGDTFDRLRELNPDIKVLLSSGYSIDGQAAEILGRGCLGFIQKPFNMKELSGKIREIIDQ